MSEAWSNGTGQLLQRNRAAAGEIVNRGGRDPHHNRPFRNALIAAGQKKMARTPVVVKRASGFKTTDER